MGHSEMLLAVAGLGEDEIRRRTRKLAAGDWSDYTPADQQAFRFAHRLASRPADLADAELKALVDTFGRHRAVDLIWYGAWCNYMTRVADSFQLPLEKTNVFAPPKDATKGKGGRGGS